MNGLRRRPAVTDGGSPTIKSFELEPDPPPLSEPALEHEVLYSAPDNSPPAGPPPTGWRRSDTIALSVTAALFALQWYLWRGSGEAWAALPPADAAAAQRGPPPPRFSGRRARSVWRTDPSSFCGGALAWANSTPVARQDGGCDFEAVWEGGAPAVATRCERVRRWGALSGEGAAPGWKDGFFLAKELSKGAGEAGLKVHLSSAPTIRMHSGVQPLGAAAISGAWTRPWKETRMQPDELLRWDLRGGANEFGGYAYLMLESAALSQKLRAGIGALSELTVSYRKVDQVNIWLSPRGVCTPLHYDVYANSYVQLVGHKRFVLLPPTAATEAAVHLHPRPHPATRSSALDLEHDAGGAAGGPGLSEEEREKVAALGAQEVVLSPGEVLFIPPYWLHHVCAIGDEQTGAISVSASVHTESDAARARERMLRHPLPIGGDAEAGHLTLRAAALRCYLLHFVTRALFSPAPPQAEGQGRSRGGRRKRGGGGGKPEKQQVADCGGASDAAAGAVDAPLRLFAQSLYHDRWAELAQRSRFESARLQASLEQADELLPFLKHRPADTHTAAQAAAAAAAAAAADADADADADAGPDADADADAGAEAAGGSNQNSLFTSPSPWVTLEPLFERKMRAHATAGRAILRAQGVTAEVRRLETRNYVEDVSAAVIGAQNVGAFLRELARGR